MVYDYSKKMWLIGQQRLSDFLSHTKGLKDIIESYEVEYNYPISNADPLLDAFALGFIEGKRAERSKKKGKVNHDGEKAKDEKEKDGTGLFYSSSYSRHTVQVGQEKQK